MRILFSSLLSFLAVTTGIDAHSYLTLPSPRFVGGVCRWSAPSDQFGQLFCKGPCETTQKNAGRLHQAQRGQRIPVAWSRNNHGGGFVRLAWAPTAQSDDPNVFNNNVQKYSCYEVGNGCLADNGQPSGGGDNDGTQNTQCNTAIEIPNWLPNGRYTLQWSWFGGIFDFSDYYSCADFEITGGPNAPAQFGRAVNNAKPVFEGGDVRYPGEQACELVNTDRLGVCVREPCRDPVNNPTRNPFAAQFPYNQRKRGVPFSPTELVMMPGRINTAESRGSSGSDGTVVPGGTPPANPGTVNPVSPPAPTGDSIQEYSSGVPATVGTTGGFNVGVQFSATAPSIIFADLLQTGTWTKYGWASSEVGTGAGQQNLRINVGAGLTAGSNYIINLWIVKRTEYAKDPNTAWQRAVIKGYPVTVVNGAAATYPGLATAIDGIPGSIPRAVPSLNPGQVFSVSFSYAASTTRVLQVDLLGAPDFTPYFGGGSVTVPGGRGRATIDVRVTAPSGGRTEIYLNLVSKAPGTEWNTPGSLVRTFPVKIENTLRLASAEGEQAIFNSTTLDWGDLPADSFDNDVEAPCVPISATQSVCDPTKNVTKTTIAPNGGTPSQNGMNGATSTSTSAVESICALVMVTVAAFLTL